eukprot:8421761-Pyramimonas_sp.AAC.1
MWHAVPPLSAQPRCLRSVASAGSCLCAGGPAARGLRSRVRDACGRVPRHRRGGLRPAAEEPQEG